MCLQRIKTICSWSYGEMNSFILLERVGSFTSTNSFIKVITRTYVLNKYSVMTNTSTGCVLWVVYIYTCKYMSLKHNHTHHSLSRVYYNIFSVECIDNTHSTEKLYTFYSYVGR